MLIFTSMVRHSRTSLKTELLKKVKLMPYKGTLGFFTELLTYFRSIDLVYLSKGQY